MSGVSGVGRSSVKVGLVVSPWFPQEGGAQKYVREIALRLATRGFEFRVLTLAAPAEASRVDAEDLGDNAVLHTSRVALPRFLPRRGVSLEFLRRSRQLAAWSDIFHVHSVGTRHAAASAAVAAMSRSRVLVTTHFHSPRHRGLASRSAVRANVKVATFRAAGVVFVGEAERAEFNRDFGSSAARSWIVPPGVDPDLVSAEGFAGEPTTIVVVGRVAALKRTGLVVEAFQRLARPGTQLVVVGDGPDRKRIEASCRSGAAGASVRFVGSVTTPELHRWLKTGTLLVSASSEEAFGMASVEASSCGMHVLASDIPAHLEIARFAAPATFFHFPHDIGPTELAQQMALALDRAVADIGPRTGNPPTWEQAAIDYASIYRFLLDGSS